jgi:L-asparaginase/Glu-tRNA(Gln) amidotransferase subunit D
MELINGELCLSGPNSMEVKMKKLPVFYDKNETFLLGSKSLVTQPIEGTIFIYDIHQLQNIIDSAESSIEFMNEVRRLIKINYKLYDCFLIIHGTDTMEHTAASLSFTISNLTKPIVLTGSQIPLSNIVNDAYRNLLGCFRVLGMFISEVFDS